MGRREPRQKVGRGDELRGPSLAARTALTRESRSGREGKPDGMQAAKVKESVDLPHLLIS